jgi:hypothetical protein
MTDIMGEVTRAVSAGLLFALVIWPSTGSTTPSVSRAPSGCGPAPTVLENPPEMARVDGRIQSIELEIRQDGDRMRTQYQEGGVQLLERRFRSGKLSADALDRSDAHAQGRGDLALTRPVLPIGAAWTERLVCSAILGWPSCFPSAFALASPTRMRSWINARPNSAKAPKSPHRRSAG